MSDVILHHYAGSPFAEKARMMLGFKGLAWRSVDIPRIMPKPDLTALTGGYRKTPVMQVGADIYCDTASQSEVVVPFYHDKITGVLDIDSPKLNRFDADDAAFFEQVVDTLITSLT